MKDKKFAKAKNLFHDLINKDTDSHKFFARFFHEYFVSLKNDLTVDIKQHVFLPLGVMISDLTYELTHFRVYCHLFH